MWHIGYQTKFKEIFFSSSICFNCPVVIGTWCFCTCGLLSVQVEPAMYKLVCGIMWGRGNDKCSVLIHICLQLFIGSILNYLCQSRWNWIRPVLAVHVASLIWGFLFVAGDNMFSDTSTSNSQKHQTTALPFLPFAVLADTFFLPFLRKLDFYFDSSCKSLTAHRQ